MRAARKGPQQPLPGPPIRKRIPGLESDRFFADLPQQTQPLHAPARGKISTQRPPSSAAIHAGSGWAGRAHMQHGQHQDRRWTRGKHAQETEKRWASSGGHSARAGAAVGSRGRTSLQQHHAHGKRPWPVLSCLAGMGHRWERDPRSSTSGRLPTTWDEQSQKGPSAIRSMSRAHHSCSPPICTSPVSSSTPWREPTSMMPLLRGVDVQPSSARGQPREQQQ
jgi:hypothetical protein